MRLNLPLPTRPPTWRRALLLPLGFTAAALMLDLLLRLVGQDAPFLPFVGAVLASTFYGGRLGGVIAAATGGALAQAQLAPAAGTLGGILLFWLFSAALVWVVEALILNLRDELQQNQQLLLVRGELQHRIRNMLAVTQSIARHTGRSAASIEDYEVKLAARLRALGLAQDLLGEARQGSTPVDGVIGSALAPFMADGRISVERSGCFAMEGSLVAPLTLLLNELATNAVKHGALSASGGRVLICCRGAGTEAWLDWVETGGPPVTAPGRTGFGSTLIRAAIPAGKGKVEVRYEADGLRCAIRLTTGRSAGSAVRDALRKVQGRDRAFDSLRRAGAS